MCMCDGGLKLSSSFEQIWITEKRKIMAFNLFQDLHFSHCSLENTLGQSFLVDNFVDGGLFIARTRHNVLIIRRNVTTQHRRRLLRL